MFVVKENIVVSFYDGSIHHARVTTTQETTTTTTRTTDSFSKGSTNSSKSKSNTKMLPMGVLIVSKVSVGTKLFITELNWSLTY